MSALAGVAVIYYNGKQGRMRATIDLIMHQKSDASLLEAVTFVYRLQGESVQFSSYANKPDSKELQCILKVLNNHEFIAAGIHQKTFDEDMYKNMQYSNVLKVWNASAGIVAEIRHKNGIETLFQEFERLAVRWKKFPIKRI